MWHYSSGGQTFGPFDREQIEELVQNGTINQGTMLWCEGTPTWLPAYQTIFKYLFSPRMVPPTLSSAAPTPIATPAPEPKKENKIVTVVAYLVGGVIGFLAVQFLPGKLLIQIFAGGLAGTLIGLIPFFVGKKRNLKLAKIALGSCAICGMILGLILALPVAVEIGRASCRERV